MLETRRVYLVDMRPRVPWMKHHYQLKSEEIWREGFGHPKGMPEERISATLDVELAFS